MSGDNGGSGGRTLGGGDPEPLPAGWGNSSSGARIGRIGGPSTYVGLSIFCLSHNTFHYGYLMLCCVISASTCCESVIVLLRRAQEVLESLPCATLRARVLARGNLLPMIILTEMNPMMMGRLEKTGSLVVNGGEALPCHCSIA